MALNDFLLSKEDSKDVTNLTNSIISFWTLLAFLFYILVALCIWPEINLDFSREFWMTMFVYPIGISTLVGAVLIGYREMGPVRANKESADLRAAAMSLASRPLALLG